MLFSLAVESVQPPAPSHLAASAAMGEPSSPRGPVRFEVNQELKLGVAMLTMEEDEVTSTFEARAARSAGAVECQLTSPPPSIGPVGGGVPLDAAR